MAPSTALRIGVGRFYASDTASAALPTENDRLGGNPLIIGSTTSLARTESTWSALPESVVVAHDGACTRAAAKEYAETARARGCSHVIGIGGGKTMDLAKAVSVTAGLPILTMPTSLATCAASSAICIMYTEDGRPDGAMDLAGEIDVVIADTTVLAAAPKRLLASGLLDSVAKLPELLGSGASEDDESLGSPRRVAPADAGEIWRFVTTRGAKMALGQAVPDTERLAFVNLLLTSTVSGLVAGIGQLALGHGFYDFMRARFHDESAHLLHGELVGAGVLLQLAYNGEPAEEYRALLQSLSGLRSLQDTGFPDDPESARLLRDYLEGSGVLTARDLDRFDEALRTALAVESAEV